MLDRTRLKKILHLAIPCSIAQASALVMLIVDMAMVGSLGTNAIAAVGIASFSAIVVFSLVSGFSFAVRGMVAKKVGEGDDGMLAAPINNALISIVILGIPLSIVSFLIAPYYLSIMTSDADVIIQSIPYLQAMLCGVLALGINNAFEGHWTGVSKAKVFMFINLFMNGVNALLNYALIYGNFGAPELGLWGAGVSSATSMYIATLIFFVVTWKSHKSSGFLCYRPSLPLIKRLLAIALPATMHDLFSALGNVVFFLIIGMMGTLELAAANVLVRTITIISLFSIALGKTASTLVAMEVGKGNIDDAVKWGWDVANLGAIFTTVLSMPIFLFPEQFLSIFLVEPETLEMAVVPLQMLSATAGLGSFLYVFAFSLFSIGKGNLVFLVSFSTQWFLALPLVWAMVQYFHYGLFEIWIVQMIYGCSATLMITIIWMDKRWRLELANNN